MPVQKWRGFIDDPALADALVDRLVPSSLEVAQKGDSMRKLKSEGAQ